MTQPSNTEFATQITTGRSAIIGTQATARSRQIQAFVFDVDGVLTDGQMYFSGAGESLKSFSVHDGLAISWLRNLGFKLGIVTGRQSEIVAKRAAELGFDYVIQGQLDKLTGLQHIAKLWDLDLDQIGYFGDDWPDLRALMHCGFAATVATAPDSLVVAADFVASRKPGQGAVREMIEWLLVERGQWPEIQAKYVTATLEAKQ